MYNHPLTSSPDQLRHYRFKRNQILKALGKASFVNGSQFAIVLMNSRGESEVYSSSAFRAKLPGWFDASILEQARGCVKEERRVKEELNLGDLGERNFERESRANVFGINGEVMRVEEDEEDGFREVLIELEEMEETEVEEREPSSELSELQDVYSAQDESETTPTGINLFSTDVATPTYHSAPSLPSALPLASSGSTRVTRSNSLNHSNAFAPVVQQESSPPLPLLNSSPPKGPFTLPLPREEELLDNIPSSDQFDASYNIDRHPISIRTVSFSPHSLFEWYTDKLSALQAKASKSVCRAWIKVIQPDKAISWPYMVSIGRNARDIAMAPAPGWWPQDVRHKDPDALSQAERVAICIAIMRNPAISVEELERSTMRPVLVLSPDKMAVLQDLYHVLFEERKLIAMNGGNPTFEYLDVRLSIPDPPQYKIPSLRLSDPNLASALSFGTHTLPRSHSVSDRLPLASTSTSMSPSLSTSHSRPLVRSQSHTGYTSRRTKKTRGESKRRIEYAPAISSPVKRSSSLMEAIDLQQSHYVGAEGLAGRNRADPYGNPNERTPYGPRRISPGSYRMQASPSEGASIRSRSQKLESSFASPGMIKARTVIGGSGGSDMAPIPEFSPSLTTKGTTRKGQKPLQFRRVGVQPDHDLNLDLYASSSSQQPTADYPIPSYHTSLYDSEQSGPMSASTSSTGVVFHVKHPSLSPVPLSKSQRQFHEYHYGTPSQNQHNSHKQQFESLYGQAGGGGAGTFGSEVGHFSQENLHDNLAQQVLSIEEQNEMIHQQQQDFLQPQPINYLLQFDHFHADPDHLQPPVVNIGGSAINTCSDPNCNLDHGYILPPAITTPDIDLINSIQHSSEQAIHLDDLDPLYSNLPIYSDDAFDQVPGYNYSHDLTLGRQMGDEKMEHDELEDISGLPAPFIMELDPDEDQGHDFFDEFEDQEKKRRYERLMYGVSAME